LAFVSLQTIQYCPSTPTHLSVLSGENNIMNIQARPYHDHTDMARMRQLLMDGSHANIPSSYMHPGLLDWDTHYPPDEQANRRNLRLWERMDEDPPALYAWAIFLRHEGTFDLFVHPALHGTLMHETVMDEYVAWAEARAREVGRKQLWPFWAMDYDKVMIRLMKERGFIEIKADLPPPLFERSLDELPTIPLPDGFTVQGVRNEDDWRLRAQVQHSAFRPNEDWDSFAAEYAQFIGSAVYNGERDLFVRSPEGRGASACTIWFDAVNAVGLFEPVGTHPDFQGKGLGKAVMAEGMRRMKAAGMRRAIVGFDPTNAAALGLYTSMGFRASAYFAMYCKEL
jgi:ribosomal protein S18 acetylase RimI-like enzyme